LFSRLVEAHDPEGEMFDFPRLRALIAEQAEEERSLGDFLMEELYSFSQNFVMAKFTEFPF
jgi:hypothetical protein